MDRAKLIQVIHVGKGQLKLSDEDYRALLLGKVGKDSTKDCSYDELNRVLDALKKAGFKVKPGKGKPKATRPLAADRESRLIRHLWLVLHQIGLVRDPSEAALAAYCRRNTRSSNEGAGVDALQWMTDKQRSAVIEGLKRWAMRRLPQAISTRVVALDLTQREADYIMGRPLKTPLTPQEEARAQAVLAVRAWATAMPDNANKALDAWRALDAAEAPWPVEIEG